MLVSYYLTNEKEKFKALVLRNEIAIIKDLIYGDFEAIFSNKFQEKKLVFISNFDTIKCNLKDIKSVYTSLIIPKEDYCLLVDLSRIKAVLSNSLDNSFLYNIKLNDQNLLTNNFNSVRPEYIENIKLDDP